MLGLHLPWSERLWRGIEGVLEKMQRDLEEDPHKLLVGMQITVATVELEDSSVGTVPASNAFHINQSR